MGEDSTQIQDDSHNTEPIVSCANERTASGIISKKLKMLRWWSQHEYVGIEKVGIYCISVANVHTFVYACISEAGWNLQVRNVCN